MTRRKLKDPYLGVKIKAVRTLRSLTQRELAELAGVARTSVTHVERGSWPTDDIFYKLQRALGLDFEAPEVQASFELLMGDDGNHEK